MANLYDLDDDKLQTEFDLAANAVIHRSYKADRALGRRRIEVEERWAPQQKLLGAGGFGDVRLELRLEGRDGDREYRAVKQLRKLHMVRHMVDWRKEIFALKKFSHTKAFVEFLGWFEDVNNVYIAMEYFQHGTLNLYINKNMTESEAREITQQMLEGVKIMHEENFTHRDLKPENIFVVQNRPYWWIKIGDFGISKRVATNVTALQTRIGTRLYSAPEILGFVRPGDHNDKTYTNAVDIWSLACIVYQMLTLRLPFPVDTWPRDIVSFCNGDDFPEEPLKTRAVSLPGSDFVKSILVSNPADRLSAISSLRSAWFSSSLPSPRHSYDPTQTSESDQSSTTAELSMFNSSNGMLPNTWSTNTSMSSRPYVPPTELESSKIKSMSAHRELDVKMPRQKPGNQSRLLDTRDWNVVMAQSGKYVPSKADAHGIPNARVDSADPSRLIRGSRHLPATCSNCGGSFEDKLHSCGLCVSGDNETLALCNTCVETGKHCRVETHWLLVYNVGDTLEKGCPTTTISTGWFLQPIPGVKVPETPPLRPLVWRSSYPRKRRSRQGPYDFCSHCRTTFPCNDPPARHVWEQHDTVPSPVTPYKSTATPTAVTTRWVSQALLDAIAEHELKISKMEEEMKKVFAVKVKEKQDLIENSEQELYARHKEMKDALEKERVTLEEKKKKRLEAKATLPDRSTEKPSISKRFAGAFRRS